MLPHSGTRARECVVAQRRSLLATRFSGRQSATHTHSEVCRVYFGVACRHVSRRVCVRLQMCVPVRHDARQDATKAALEAGLAPAPDTFDNRWLQTQLMLQGTYLSLAVCARCGALGTSSLAKLVLLESRNAEDVYRRLHDMTAKNKPIPLSSWLLRASCDLNVGRKVSEGASLHWPPIAGFINNEPGMQRERRWIQTHRWAPSGGNERSHRGLQCNVSPSRPQVWLNACLK